MISVGQNNNIRFHFVHNRNKAMEEGIGGLAGQMWEIFVLTAIGLEKTSLHLICTLMKVLECGPNLMSKNKILHSIELSMTQTWKQNINSFVVCEIFVFLFLTHAIWRNYVSLILSNFPHTQFSTFQMGSHVSLPISVICSIKVGRGIRGRAVGCHNGSQNRFRQGNDPNRLWYQLKDQNRRPEGGWMGASNPIRKTGEKKSLYTRCTSNGEYQYRIAQDGYRD